MKPLQIQEILEANGYDVKVTNDGESLIVGVGSANNPIPACLVFEDDKLEIAVQLTTLGAIGEDRLPEFFYQALDLNTSIAPFATAIVSEEDEDVDTHAVVLIDTIPLCDLQDSEVLSALESLNVALVSAGSLLESFFIVNA